MTAVYDRLDENFRQALPLLERPDVKRIAQDAAGSSSLVIGNVTLTVSPVDNETCQSNRSKIVGCVEAIFTALYMFGMRTRHEDSAVQNSYESTINHWSSQANKLGNGGWMKFAKWKIASFVHFITKSHSEPPPIPKGISDKGEILVNGLVGRFVKRLCKSSKGLEFIQTLTDSKKGCPRPGQDELQQALKSTFEVLTSARQVVKDGEFGPVLFDIKENKNQVKWAEDLLNLSSQGWEDWANVKDVEVPAGLQTVLGYNSAKEQLLRTVDELFTGKDFDVFMKSRSPMYMASTSSTFDSSRAKGGAVNDIMNYIKEAGLFDEFLVFYGKEESMDLFSDEQDFIDIGPLLDQQAKLISFLRTKYLRGELDNKVKMVALSEALKVRVITKGNAGRTYLLQPLQKFLHGTLKEHKVFKLIGEPVTALSVQKAMGKRLGEGYKFLSGDYSQATNLLAPWAARIVAERICDLCNIDYITRNLFIDALINHEIENPDVKGEYKMQMWGQLMGSVISFPILCIINLCVCRWAIEINDLRTRYARDCNLMINGDDCLLKVQQRGFEAWKAIGAFFGLEPSVGKYFYLEQFAQINSMNFSFKHEADGLGMHYFETPYVNLGLYYGLSRSKSETDDIEFEGSGYGSRCREMIRRCPRDIRTTVFQMWFNHHKPMLKKRYKNIPLFVPESFGGLGLPIFTDDPKYSHAELDLYENVYHLGGLDRQWSPTDLDLRCCHRFLRHDGLPRRLGLPKMWLIRDMVKRDLGDAKVLSFVKDENTEMLFNLIGCSLMYSSDVQSIKTNITPKALNKRFDKQIKNLMTLWSKTIKLGNSLPTPLSLKTILTTPLTYDVYPIHIKDTGRVLGPGEVKEYVHFRENRERFAYEILENQHMLDNLWV